MTDYHMALIICNIYLAAFMLSGEEPGKQWTLGVVALAWLITAFVLMGSK